MYIAPAGTSRFGGFWIRVVAALIDAIAVGIVTGPISLLIGVITGVAGHAVAMPKPGVDVASFLKEATQSVTQGRRATRLRRLLVAGEIACAMLLLTGAGLTTKLFLRARTRNQTMCRR